MPSKKILIPLTQENVTVVGTRDIALPKLVDMLIAEHLNNLFNKHGPGEPACSPGGT